MTRVMGDPVQPKKLTYVEFSAAHEALAHVFQVCAMAGLACTVLACGALLIPAADRPVYIFPCQFAVSLMWGVHFVCTESGDGNYLEWVLGNSSHPRFRIFSLLFRRYLESHEKEHTFTRGLNKEALAGTGFTKLGKGTRGQYSGVEIWGRWADDAFFPSWVVRHAELFRGRGWLEGSIPRPIGMPENAAARDIFSDSDDALSEIPRKYRGDQEKCIERAETWWRMVCNASDSELQAGKVREWALAWNLWKVAPFTSVARSTVAPVASSVADSGARTAAETVRAASPRHGGTEVSSRSEAPELGSAVDGVSSLARERRGERTVHPGIRALIDDS